MLRLNVELYRVGANVAEKRAKGTGYFSGMAGKR